MKRSDVDNRMRAGECCIVAQGWALPPKARRHVTDFEFGVWRQFALALVDLAEEPEYCERLMCAEGGMRTPVRCPRFNKKDTTMSLGQAGSAYMVGTDEVAIVRLVSEG